LDGRGVAIALVIGLLVGAGATYVLAGPRQIPATVTSVITTTTVADVIGASTAPTLVTSIHTTTSAMMYYVVFEQSGYCIGSPVTSYEDFWSVTLGNETQVKTWNAT
jgi:hypothetical protein